MCYFPSFCYVTFTRACWQYIAFHSVMLSCHIHACFAYYIQMHNISIATAIYWQHTPDCSSTTRWWFSRSLHGLNFLCFREANLKCGYWSTWRKRSRSASSTNGCFWISVIFLHLVDSSLLKCIWFLQLLPVFLRSICIFHTVNSVATYYRLDDYTT